MKIDNTVHNFKSERNRNHVGIRSSLHGDSDGVAALQNGKDFLIALNLSVFSPHTAQLLCIVR